MPRISEDKKIILLHHFEQGQSAAKTHRELMKVYGNDAPHYQTIRKWFASFKKGNKCLKYANPSGRPKTFKDEELIDALKEQRGATSRNIAEKIDCNQTTVCRRLKKMNLRWRKTQEVPHELSEKNKLDRLNACKRLLKKQKKTPFLKKLITCDEKWVLYDNNRPRKHWVGDDLPVLQVPRSTLTDKKALLCVWWDARGPIHWEMLPYGQTIDSDIYQSQLQRLAEKLKKVRPSLVNRKGVILQQDNARPHVSKSTKEFIKNLNWELLEHPPYSPDIAPSDFYLFRSLECYLRGKCFADHDALKNGINSYFASKTASFFKKAFDDLPKKWERVIECNGSYFN